VSTSSIERNDRVFFPSGLWAHRFHKALISVIVSGEHERRGDAVLAAQAAHAETGVRPELLVVPSHLWRSGPSTGLVDTSLAGSVSESTDSD